MKKIICLVVLFTLLISGCTAKKAVVTENAEPILGYDAQSYFSSAVQDILKVEDGYYRLNNNMLTFIENGSDTAIPLCNKVNCSHENKPDSDCDAMWKSDKYMASKIYGLWYYDKDIYVGALEQDLATQTCDINIYKISRDGSVKTKMFTMASFIGIYDLSFGLYCHQGYMYLQFSEAQSKVVLLRAKLKKNSKAEQIYSVEGNNVILTSFYPYKDGVAFLITDFTNADYTEMNTDIMYYSAENNKVETLLGERQIDDFCIVEDCIYYVSESDILSYNLKDNKEATVYEFENPIYMSYDGKYLYADDCAGWLMNIGFDISKHNIYALDFNGRLIDTLTVSSSCICNFGDENYIFQQWDWDKESGTWLEKSVLKIFDKSQLGTGKQEWITIK